MTTQTTSSPAAGAPAAVEPTVLTARATVSTPAVFMVIGSCVSIQIGASFAGLLFPHMSSWGVIWLRLGIAALLLLVICRPNVRGWTRDTWLYTFLLGACLFTLNAFFYASMQTIPQATAVSIQFLGPLLLAAALSRGRKDFFCVGLAFVGMAMLGINSLTGDPLDPKGIGLILIAAAGWAGYILCSRKVGQLTTGTSGLAVAMVFAALIATPFGAIQATPAFGNPTFFALAFATAVLASVIPYTLEIQALRSLPSNVFGVLLCLEPVVAVFAGWLILGQQLTPLALAAIGCVVVASVCNTLPAEQLDPRRFLRRHPS